MLSRLCRTCVVVTIFTGFGALPGPGAAGAAGLAYQIQPLLQGGRLPSGEWPAGIPIPASKFTVACPLNDRGQLLIDLGTDDGTKPDTILQYANGGFTPILVAGSPGPVGTWPKDVFNFGPAPQDMNQQGDVVFAVRSRGSNPLGTFLWNAVTQTVTPVALKGMPAGGGLTFTTAYGGSPAINNRGEIALAASVQGAAGTNGPALFFRAADGGLQPILLPGQALPDGTKARTDSSPQPSIDDTGRVAFLTRRQGDKQYSAYVWEQGTLAPVLTEGTMTPQGAVTSVTSVFLSHQDRSLLITAGIGGSRQQGIYRISTGQITPLVVPGQVMPDGSHFATIQNVGAESEGQLLTPAGLSDGNDAGQRVFMATLEDGATAAYLLDADGKLSLILKRGMTTDLGPITDVMLSPAGPNHAGQVALTVTINHGPQTLLLLTPAAAP
jgi:hypothetical protein